MFNIARSCRAAVPSRASLRLLHASAATAMPRAAAPSKPQPDQYPVTVEDLEKTVEEMHIVEQLWVAQQRRLLYYMRLIEHELPQLVAFRKPFVPPPPSQPLIVRSISYGGEEHPVTAKRTIVTPVSRLPLKNEAAIHKFKLLAGVRWSIEPPKDGGIGLSEMEACGEHGYFKISCEDFPQSAMNLKWASDVIDRLVAEANDTKDTFADVPLDMSHLVARARKAGKGEYIRGRAKRSTIRDFPKEWLPCRTANPSPSSTQ